MTRKELDLECADRLENLAEFLRHDDSICQGKMSFTEYENYISSIRYAIATLRSNA